MTKVLLVDDDVELTTMLSQYLAREGFDVHAVNEGEAGAIEVACHEYAIVVLDIMMPRVSGLEVLRRIRTASTVPVLMLTARGDHIDRVVGLNMGADDYVSKPCTPEELVARVRAILRRTERDSSQQTDNGANSRGLQVGPLMLWPGKQQAEYIGRNLDLTGTEFRLLEVLMRHAGQLISKQDISLHVFGKPLARFDRRIDVHISSIRQKLGMRDDGRPWIQSVRGLGYQLLQD